MTMEPDEDEEKSRQDLFGLRRLISRKRVFASVRFGKSLRGCVHHNRRWREAARHFDQNKLMDFHIGLASYPVEGERTSRSHWGVVTHILSIAARNGPTQKKTSIRSATRVKGELASKSLSPSHS